MRHRQYIYTENREANLHTEGYQVTFLFQSLPSSKELPEIESSFDLILRFQFPHQSEKISLQSTKTVIRKTDIQMMINYFTDHIEHLSNNTWHTSHTFTPLNLGFQLQALEGDGDSIEEGYFNLIFMITMEREENSFRSYIGGNAVIRIQSVNVFLDELRAVL